MKCRNMKMRVKMRRLVLPIVAIFVIFSLVLSVGCQLVQKTEQTVENTAAATVTTAITSNTTSITTNWEAPVVVTSAQTLPSIAAVVAMVKPSVVAINVITSAVDMFYGSYTQEGAGSGWIISQDGLIVTNNHVVAGAVSINVVLDDGRTFEVDMDTVHTDELSDLAVMKIDATGLPAAMLGDSSALQIGDWVVAIGNSLGQGIRATQGIVSRKDVSLDTDTGETLSGLIETDAAINAGNSGGPLVNMAGQVIGITNAKMSAVGVEGVGYAISSNGATAILESLVYPGYVVRPYLGISMYTVDDWVTFRYRLPVNTGVLVTDVGAGSPANNAGIQAGDVIVRYNGQDVTTKSELLNAILDTSIGQTVEVVFWHNNIQKTVQTVITESPKPE
jgi:serine protease Do